jgi:hypothetical protein
LAGADEEAKGAGRALEALGLDPEKLRAMDTAEAMKVVADELAKYKDGAGKTALALDLLGKSGAKLLPYLKDLAEAQSLAGSLTTEQAAAAEQLEKAWKRLSSEGGSVAKALVLDMIPAFASVLDYVQGAKIGIAQFGASLAVVAKDIQTAALIASEGFGVTEAGRAKIAQLIEERNRFVEAANEDMEKRLGTYKSIRAEVDKTLAGGGAQLPKLDYTSRDAKEAKPLKVKAEKELDALDIAYGGYKGAYKDFVDAIKRKAADAEAAADADVKIEEEHQKRILNVVRETAAYKLDVLQKELQDAAALMEEGAINEDQWAEFAQVRIDAFNKAGLRVEGAKNAIDEGVDAVADRLVLRLDPNDKDGKRRFARLYVSPKCKETIGEFGKYRRRRDPKNPERVLDAIEDKDNHCFVAGTLVTTDKGDVPIERITTGMRVLTRQGFYPVRAAGMTRENAEVWTLATSDGQTLTGTPDHLVWVEEKGWTRLCELTSTNTLCGPGDRTKVIVAARALDSAPVFDLTVDGPPEFFANGVLVHNCMDSLRYLAYTRFGGPDRSRAESGPGWD